MNFNHSKNNSGFTIIELVISMVISSILMLVIGVLVASSARGWQQNYDVAHKGIFEDATNIITTFTSVGRKSNSTNYKIYNSVGSVFTPVVSATPGVETVVSGNAVEFRYWDVPLDQEDSHDIMNVSVTATAYALFYIQGTKLKVDYGPLPPGGVPATGGAKNTVGVKSMTLAENVTVGPGGCGAFSHTELSGKGKGSIRINLVLTDPEDGQTIRISNSVLLRNKWPR
jgi:prepilin-type N-terminal cleavage/methylation domain-containing protein